MGLVHPLHVVGRINGRRRPLAVLHLKFADPGWDMVQVTRRILSYLKHSKRYVDLELAWAERVCDREWNRDAEAELQQRKRDMPKGFSHSRNEYEAHLNTLEKECYAAYVPKFPFIHTCLLLGAISSDWDNGYLHTVGHRPWNAAPDYGGKYMWEPGCTVVDLSDLSYAFVLPKEKAISGGDGEPYLSLEPISGHQWLKCFGLHDPNPDIDDVWAFRGHSAPLMSKEALQEVWPCFLRNMEYNKHSSTDEKEKELQNAGIPAKTEVKKASAARKRKREANSTDERVEIKIEQLLKSCPKKILAAQIRTKRFPSLLRRYIREHPERFTADCPGAVSLVVASLICNQSHVGRVELKHLHALSANQVLEVVTAVVRRNQKNLTGDTRPLQLLDLSFNTHVRPDDVGRILNVTDVYELIIWDNPGLPLEAIADVASGRIAKVTSRAGFLAPLEKWVQRCLPGAEAPVRVQPAPPMLPAQTRIRQVVWMTLATFNIDASQPPTELAAQLRGGTAGPLSLEDLDRGRLPMVLHPMFYREGYGGETPNAIFAELVGLPLHDTWRPLAELYRSLARIEKFMTNERIVGSGGNLLGRRWPLAFPLLMTLGCSRSEYAVCSPLPAQAFELAIDEVQGSSCVFPLRARGPDPILHGEYSLVFLREPDHGRLRYGLVTRNAVGQLEVQNPADAARAVGDEEAVRAWDRGVGALPAWTADQEQRQRPCRDTMLLEAAAVETILAASAEFAARETEFCREIYNIKAERNRGAQGKV